MCKIEPYLSFKSKNATNHLSKYQCCVGISFTCIYPLGTSKVYYLFYLFFSKSIYLNQMPYSKNIELRKYIHFITLDISKKYPYLKPSMFSNLGKFHLANFHPNYILKLSLLICVIVVQGVKY